MNDDAIELLKVFVNAVFDPTSLTKNLRNSAASKYPRILEPIKNVNNNVYIEAEDNGEEEYTESDSIENTPSEDVESYNAATNNKYSNKEKEDSSNPQGVIDSIAQELTSVRLQQAIILSEIVGKPRSKIRRKRRF
ncbi:MULTISPECIES: hypothetical protein [unclassified Clostridium]|uniref:hypothetical protein n=1 Tax=unclassified Clostridium TaxID=2614128 RepID=UPI0002975535|nr:MULTISPECIES: hypothetical protein [unclassified Clostridium]EKQ51525.1 MAG: hypothetical protein A370_04831 [Clostridium sp. Maddingley MBC34-26]